MNYEMLAKQMMKWRHELHRCPEPGMEEYKTSDYIAARLDELGIEYYRNIGKTGIVGVIKAGTGERKIGLRADIDALEYDEVKQSDYRSENPGWMHACGHDGHISMLLGAAKVLSEEKDFDGTVYLVFQPGEEPGLGARAMLDDGLLERFPMEAIYGMHNDPQAPLGTIRTRVGGAKSSLDDFKITIHGQGTHSSAPHTGKDPIVIAAEIISALQTIVSRCVSPQDIAVVTCTDVRTDGIKYTIPSEVVIEGDCRTFNPKVQKVFEEKMRAISTAICGMYGATCDVEYALNCLPVINDAARTAIAVEAAKRVVGVENVDGNCAPVTSSEDFSFYCEKIPACYCFLGARTVPGYDVALHNPNFDFNDAALLYGARLYLEIVRGELGKKV